MIITSLCFFCKIGRFSDTISISFDCLLGLIVFVNTERSQFTTNMRNRSSELRGFLKLSKMVVKIFSARLILNKKSLPFQNGRPKFIVVIYENKQNIIMSIVSFNFLKSFQLVFNRLHCQIFFIISKHAVGLRDLHIISAHPCSSFP